MPKAKEKQTQRMPWKPRNMTAALDAAPPPRRNRYNTAFSGKQGDDLIAFLIEIDKISFGLTRKQCRILIYKYAECEKISHKFSHSKKIASAKWFKRFLQENNLTLNFPTATLLNSESAIRWFFQVLGEVRAEKNLTAYQIFHVIEMVYSLADPEEERIVVDKDGVRSATILCCGRGTGDLLPPFMIFPREDVSPELLSGAPSGTLAVAEKSGSNTLNTFTIFLEFFSQLVMPTADAPALLLVANHNLMLSPAALKFAKEHNIILMGFPRNVPYQLKPLSVSFIGAMQTHFAQAIDSFYIARPRSVVTDNDLASLFGYAFSRVCATDCVSREFKKSGIEPFYPDVFECVPLSS